MNIKDAKKGDILFIKENNIIFIFREYVYGRIKHYALLNRWGLIALSWFDWNRRYTIVPATDEQKDLLLNTISKCKDFTFVLDLVKKGY